MLFTFLIEGRGLGVALAEMERSDEVRVIGPHIGRHFSADPKADEERIVVTARAETVAAAQELLWAYLQPESNYAVSVGLLKLGRPEPQATTGRKRGRRG